MSDLGKAIRQHVAETLRRAGIEPHSDGSNSVIQGGSVFVSGGDASVQIERVTGGVCVGNGYAVVGGLYWMTRGGDVIRDGVLHRGGEEIAGTPVPNRGSRCRVEIHMGNMWINHVRIPEYRGGQGGSSVQTF